MVNLFNLPWEAKEDGIIYGTLPENSEEDEAPFIADCCESNWQCMPRDKLNARFIVLAANHHNLLLEALECPGVDKAHTRLARLVDSESASNDAILEAAITLCAELDSYHGKRRAAVQAVDEA